MKESRPMPQNYPKHVKYIEKNYGDAGVTVPNGFQKDAIQNAVGARKSDDFKGWSCDISLVPNPKFGYFVVVEDSGTVGLVGENVSSDRIVEMTNAGHLLGPEERLARFTSLFNSGGNYGPGLYGVGKAVYSMASDDDDCCYYFDSLRGDGKYVANYNDKGQVGNYAYEDDEAREYIRNETGLEPKTTVGTRIIVRKPKEAVIDAILDGKLVRFIQESWWLLMERYPKDFRITVDGKRVTLPEGFKEAVNSYETDKPVIADKSHKEMKIKRFGLYVRPKDSDENRLEEWQGVCYYRKGMKIGEVKIDNVPEKLKGRFWGFVEVNEEWETALAEIEDTVHAGVSKAKKKCTAYRILKNYCNRMFDDLMGEWGYRKTPEEEKNKLKGIMDNVKARLDNLFDRMRMENLGKGIKRPNFDIRLLNVRFPNPDTERVATGDEISFGLEVESRFLTEREFSLNISVLDGKTDSFISVISRKKIIVRPDIPYKETFRLCVSEYNSNRFAKNRIVATVKPVTYGTGKTREIPFYYDTDKPAGGNRKGDVFLSLYGCGFPLKGSRRVDFGQALKDVSWKIGNARKCALEYRLNVTVHDAEKNDRPLIREIAVLDGTVGPFGDEVTALIKEIPFNKEDYGNSIAKGRVELRAELVARESDDSYEKGERIKSCNCVIFLNADDRNGNRNAYDCESVEDPSRKERSWCVPGEGRKIVLNTAHPAFRMLAENEKAQETYVEEEMLKQYTFLYLAEGRTEPFGEGFDEYAPAEAVEAVWRKTEELNYENCMDRLKRKQGA